MGALLLVVQLLPGTPHEHETFVLAATPGLIVYGVLCVRLIMPWTTTSMGQTALVSAVLFPVVGVALWATGGAGSYMELMLFPAVLFSAWFQRPSTRGCSTASSCSSPAINPVIAMELLAEGVWSGAGVLGPEALPPAPFLDRLADYGAPHGVDERDPVA